MPTFNINITTPQQLMATANTVTDNWFWTGILLASFIIIFSVQKNRGWKTTVSFATTSFFNGILAIFLRLITDSSGVGLIGDQVTLISVVLFFVGVLVLFYQERG